MQRLFLNKLLSDLLFLELPQPAQIIESERHGQLLCNDLHLSTVNDSEARAQNFVAAHDFVDAFFQDRHVAWRDQSECIEDIEEGYVRQRALKPPQPFLRD